MKLAEKYLPPLADGEYTVEVTQEIITQSPNPDNEKETITEEDRLCGKQNFSVISRAFTLQKEDVFSVFPEENVRGSFTGELPFLVSSAKTLPWLYGEGELPWMALLAIGEEEGAREEDIKIGDLLSKKEDGIYFPADKMPERYSEEESEICHIVDVPLPLFQEIMPHIEETKYLCHAKYTDLSETEEDVSRLDGFFSVVLGNRFLPTGKVTLHVVSLLGYPDWSDDAYGGYEKVRMVSLYHWQVFCEENLEEDFRSVAKHLDTGMFSGIYDNELSRRGQCAKAYYTRSGDLTGALYHSPLVPYRPQEIPQVSSPGNSADSVLIYDSEYAVFDASYSAAWQLGRWLAVSDAFKAKKVAVHRTGILKEAAKRENRAISELYRPDYLKICRELGEKLGVWKEEAACETNAKDTGE